MSDEHSGGEAPKRSSPLKWIGCGCLIMLVLLVGGCGSMIFGVFAMIRSAEPCQQAFTAAAADAEVIAITGEPLEMGYLVSGSIQINNASGSAEISIPVSGPKGAGSVEVRATRNMSRWSYEQVVFVASDGQQVAIEMQPTVE